MNKSQYLYNKEGLLCGWLVRTIFIHDLWKIAKRVSHELN